MKAFILMSALLLLGGAAGAGTAWLSALFLAEPALDEAGSDDYGAEPDTGAAPPSADTSRPGLPLATGVRADVEYQRLDDQFLVPIVRNNAVAAMMVLTLGLEVMPGQAALIHSHEPRLRNQLLQALFDHANTGGFDGMFTSAANMRLLRESLTRAARDVLDDAIGSVLILDMVRQEPGY